MKKSNAPLPLPTGRQSSSDEALAYVLGIMSVAAFALTLPLAKVLTAHLSSMQIGVFRSMLAALAAAPILIIFRAPLPNRSQIKRLLLTSIGIVYGFPILTALGMAYVPVSHGGVVLAALPLSTSIFGALITKDRPPAAFWVVSVAGFLTVLLFTIVQHGVSGVYLGDIALLGAVVLAGFGYAQGGALSKELKGWQVMCWTLTISLPFLIPLSFIFYDHGAMTSLDGAGWAALAFLAFVNSLLGFFTWNRALALGGIQRISQLQLLQPFITYGYSIVFMHESLDWLTLGVCAVVIGLVVLSKYVSVRR